MARGGELGTMSQPDEVPPVDLEVVGQLPDWLSGSLVRTVPGRYEVGGRRIEHWFDGLALLNAFVFEHGRVHYASRYLQTDTLQQATAGHRPRRGFANDPCLSLFARMRSIFAPTQQTLTDNGNVNIGRLGEKWVALTEAPMAVAFDPLTLETLGLIEHRDTLGFGHATPHPHYGETGAMVNSMLDFGLDPTYRLYEAGADGTRRQLASLRVRKPAYMHSFAMTERHLVLVEQPWVIDPLQIARSGRPLRALVDYFTWKPELGTRVRVFSRRTGHLIRTARAPAMFLFHVINAYDDDDDVVIDVCAYEDPSIVDAFFLEAMARADTGFPVARPRRLRVGLRDGRVTTRLLADVDLELPVIDYAARNGRPYSFAYGVGRHDDDHRSMWDQLVKLDVTSGKVSFWHPAGGYPSEPVFVAHPERHSEDDGVVLSVVLDHRNEGSFLLVLDARTFREIARATAPQRIPLGFHGQHVPATNTVTTYA